MEENLWALCHGQNHMGPIQETAWRIVEAQHILATRKLVDSAREQDILEELIDAVKPTLFGKAFVGLHPLLYTPFRYPPLQYGSRFGARQERSLWYGSLKLTTAMAEKAFYQFNFLRGSHADFGTVSMPLTAFATQIKTAKGVDLAKQPFAQYQEKISSPTHYQDSQQLGTAMRQHNIEAFYYVSARDPEGFTNIGIFTPRAFLQKKPLAASFQTWQCIINHNTVEFVRASAIKNETKIFTLESFLVNKVLPFPAS